MLAFRLESREEAAVIFLFHVAGTVMELFKTALRLARHRELIDGSDGADVAKRRRQFADEIATATRRVNEIAELARAR